MPRRRDDDSDLSAPSIMAEGEDSGDTRTWESDGADAVRRGDLSAAQLPEGHGNVDPDNPDAQYPPGVVDNTAVRQSVSDNPASHVPKRRAKVDPGSNVVNTAATPTFNTAD